MKKILFIMPEVSSMPSIVNGGAVETLIEKLLEKNEEEKKYQITIVSQYDKISFDESLKYHYTNFEYIKINYLKKKIKKRFYKLFRYFLSREKLEWEDYLKKIKRKIEVSQYDKIIIENRPAYVNELKCRNIILHLHNNHLSNLEKKNEKIYKKCSEIWCISEYVKKSTEQGDNEKVKLFNNCIDMELFNKDLYNEDRKKLRKKYNINEDDVVFMFSGRLAKIKGIK